MPNTLPVRYVASAWFLSSASQVPSTRPSGRDCGESCSVDGDPIALSIRTIADALVSGRLSGERRTTIPAWHLLRSSTLSYRA